MIDHELVQSQSCTLFDGTKNQIGVPQICATLRKSCLTFFNYNNSEIPSSTHHYDYKFPVVGFFFKYLFQIFIIIDFFLKMSY
jgi:hypothetical protein